MVIGKRKKCKNVDTKYQLDNLYLPLKTILLTITIICLISSTLLTGCSQNMQRNESPALYYKNVEATIIDCDYMQWFAGYWHYRYKVVVYSTEYDIGNSFEIDGTEARNMHDKYKEGDTVNCLMCSLKMLSTGEIINRKIMKINQ